MLQPEFRPPWFNPTMPPREDVVLSYLLENAKDNCPNDLFVVFEDGSSWTYLELYDKSVERAASLQKFNIHKNDKVLVWLPNGSEMLLSWFAINLIGACFVPINVSYIGNILEHVVNNSSAKLLIGHDGLLKKLQDLELKNLKNIISTSDNTDIKVNKLDVFSRDALECPSSIFKKPNDLHPWDLQSIIYTSGTTGPSKGVLSSYFHLSIAARCMHGHLKKGDRILVNGPMNHISGTCAVYAALINHSSIALIESFSANNFWDQMMQFECTVSCGLIGSMAQILGKNSIKETDRNNPLRFSLMYPVTKKTIELSKRFNFSYMSGYGMTEIAIPMVSDVNSTVLGSCGKPRSGIECRLVDDNDIEVPIGKIGELVVRSDFPYSISTGYHGMPEATAEAWANGWFHTGDLLKEDKNGYFYFVDRKKDAIRRRGENISSFEVESAVYLSPKVQEAAAIGVPSLLGEEEVMIVVSPKINKIIEPKELFNFLAKTLPHYMVPRYVRVLENMPQTPTMRVRKFILRSEGVTSDTWDREKEGIKIAREVLR
jgi:crotonobetaine/carnitine-CoA ligase